MAMQATKQSAIFLTVQEIVWLSQEQTRRFLATGRRVRRAEIIREILDAAIERSDSGSPVGVAPRREQEQHDRDI